MTLLLSFSFSKFSVNKICIHGKRLQLKGNNNILQHFLILSRHFQINSSKTGQVSRTAMRATQSRCRCGVPTLFYDELSPQSRSCNMLIKLLDIEVELKPINLINDEHLYQSCRKMNPSCTIPVLIDGQFIISDSHTIMIYLCDKYAGVYLPHLCPCDYLPRLNVLNMLFYEGCVLYRRYSHLLTEIFLKKYPNVDMSYHQAKVTDSYNSLETNLRGQLCMTGNCLTIADLSVITTLSGMDLMFPISQDEWPNLYRWFDNLKNMDCYKCNDEGIQKLAHLLETEGQFSLPLSLEAPSAMRSSLHPNVDIDKDESNFSKLKDHSEFPWNEGKALRGKEVASKRDITSNPSEIPTEKKFSNFFPKIRTSKIFISPSNTNHEAESLSELKTLYNSEGESGNEDCQPERIRHYKSSTDCVCCRRSFVLNESKMDWKESKSP